MNAVEDHSRQWAKRMVLMTVHILSWSRRSDIYLNVKLKRMVLMTVIILSGSRRSDI